MSDSLALTPAAPSTLTQWERAGRWMLVPYLLIFFLFVLYPVCYGLWLARHPESYVKLFDDPIFFRTAVNTLVFLVVAINVKMAMAMVLHSFGMGHVWPCSFSIFPLMIVRMQQLFTASCGCC